MRATKLVISIKNLTYKDTLKRLKLPTLKYRRIRGDMIELDVYKILAEHRGTCLHCTPITHLCFAFLYLLTYQMPFFLNRDFDILRLPE